MLTEIGITFGIDVPRSHASNRGPDRLPDFCLSRKERVSSGLNNTVHLKRQLIITLEPQFFFTDGLGHRNLDDDKDSTLSLA